MAAPAHHKNNHNSLACEVLEFRYIFLNNFKKLEKKLLAKYLFKNNHKTQKSKPYYGGNNNK